ncbi:MAG: carboxymuconolactone decarboxylase family protein [Candidatus Fermentibacteraceae bacterium]
MRSYEEFAREREEQNRRVLESADRVTKRFFSLDSLTYRDGALPAATKELLGLVASLVLRCDDCVAYHLGRCRDLGRTGEEVSEALGVAMVVGGSITIPHVRRAVALWGELTEKASE